MLDAIQKWISENEADEITSNSIQVCDSRGN